MRIKKRVVSKFINILFRSKKLSPLALLNILALAGIFFFLYENNWNQPAVIQAQDIRIQTCFTPNQKCQKLIIKAIKEAQQTIHVMAYYLTAPPLIDALIDAQQRGVKVKVIVDRSQLKASPLLYKLSKASIPLFNDKTVTIAHNKVMIIDQHMVITGSYNFTSSAEHRNAENLLLIHSPALASVYQRNWNQRQRGSTPFSLSSKSTFQKEKKSIDFDYFLKMAR